MDGIRECRNAGLWCDGLHPDLCQDDPTRITGEAWIGTGGRKQELWRFALVLPRARQGNEPIEWSALLPADDRTGWLSVDFAAQQLEIDPAAAIPDSQVAELLALETTPQGSELHEAEVPQAPRLLEDADFGRLTWLPRFEWSETRATWRGRRVTLTLAAGDEARLRASLATARALWREQTAWASHIERIAVPALTEIGTEASLGHGTALVSGQTFRACMRLESISVTGDGCFEFWFDGGNLLPGRAVVVCGTLADGPMRVSAPG